jgi:C-terminal peptidase prc
VRRLLPLALGLALGLPARAEAPTDLYSVALKRIETLYLDRDSLDAEALFGAAALELEEQIEWLLVDVDGPTATLYVADRGLGSVTVTDFDGLPDALRELEALVRSAPEVDPHAHLDDGMVLRTVLVKGATEALDRHSRLLYGERLVAFDKRLKGTYFGIGARLSSTDDQHIRITEVFANNPAARAGLQDGDVILRIDGQSTLGMTTDDAVDRITGRRGTTVDLVLLRSVEGVETEISATVTRDEISEPNVEWEALEEGFGYIRIDHFSELTTANLDTGLLELDDQGALERGLVIDLRGNTGGSMMQSARSADAFVTSGDLVRTVGPDGGKVKGLVEHIWADDDGTEPDIPIVILQNARTASGSEILAGSLRELDRAVLIGTRSYGKGTVQKVYTLEPGARLKLTVARYLLAGGLSIDAMGGIPPDLPVGLARFDQQGVHFSNDLGTLDGPEPLLFVDEREGWREGETPESRDQDTWVELAVRVLARTTGPERHELLAAAGEVRELVRAEEEQRMMATFSARGIDWTGTDDETAQPPTVQVEVGMAEPAGAGEEAVVRAKVTNTGTEPLHRVEVRLGSSDRHWNRMVLPVGLLQPGETRVTEATSWISPAAAARESSVDVVVMSEGRPELFVDPAILGYGGGEAPPLRIAVQLQPPDDQGIERARITLNNHGDAVLMGLRVRFEYPSSSGIDLLEYDAGIPSLGPDAESVVSLGLDLSRLEGDVIPLRVHVESARYGALASWDFELERGMTVELEAPEVSVTAPTHREEGVLDLTLDVRDDRGIDHIVVWADGDKVAYVRGEGARQKATIPVELTPGRNRYVIEVIDDQGLRETEVVYVRGLVAQSITTGE